LAGGAVSMGFRALCERATTGEPCSCCLRSGAVAAGGGTLRPVCFLAGGRVVGAALSNAAAAVRFAARLIRGQTGYGVDYELGAHRDFHRGRSGLPGELVWCAGKL